jgi:hypothetical protein
MLIVPSTQPSSSVCTDSEEGVSCQIIAAAGACDLKANGQSLRETCPQSCNCCGVDKCLCDDNDTAKKIAKAFGFPWIQSCQHVKSFANCSHKVYGSLLKQFCPCQCP